MKIEITKVIKNILYYGTILFLIIVIAISLFIPNGLVKVFGVGWYRVVSGSMEPYIMTGDYIIVVKDQDVENFKDGDVIVFETYRKNRSLGINEKVVVTHHFYKVDENGFVLTYPHSQYDKLPEDRGLDPWEIYPDGNYNVKISDVIGRHQMTIQMSGFNHFIQSPYGIFTMLMGITSIISFMILISHLKQKRRESEQLENDIEVQTIEESDKADVEDLDS